MGDSGAMTQAVVAYLSAGSNLGDRKDNLQQGVRRLVEAGLAVRRVSSIFETEPVGFQQQPWFLNIALEVETTLSPSQLLACCQEVETSAGRVRSFTGAPRTLDLDILLYGDVILDEPGLRIPHPRMHQRRFVLEPLVQIAPGLVHPELRQKVSHLLSVCADSSTVLLVSEWDSA